MPLSRREIDAVDLATGSSAFARRRARRRRRPAAKSRRGGCRRTASARSSRTSRSRCSAMALSLRSARQVLAGWLANRAARGSTRTSLPPIRGHRCRGVRPCSIAKGAAVAIVRAAFGPVPPQGRRSLCGGSFRSPCDQTGGVPRRPADLNSTIVQFAADRPDLRDHVLPAAAAAAGRSSGSTRRWSPTSAAATRS